MKIYLANQDVCMISYLTSLTMVQKRQVNRVTKEKKVNAGLFGDD